MIVGVNPVVGATIIDILFITEALLDVVQQPQLLHVRSIFSTTHPLQLIGFVVGCKLAEVFPSSLLGVTTSIQYHVNMSSTSVFAADSGAKSGCIEVIDNEKLQNAVQKDKLAETVGH